MPSNRIESTAEVTTVALLQRKHGMSDDLFTAYWRDVHGMLAARIPGFSSYVQNHTVRYEKFDQADDVADDPAFVLDGFADVAYRNEADRQGLVSGNVTPLILSDESKVFSRTLLYNLEPGGTRSLVGDIDSVAERPAASFILIYQASASASKADVDRAVGTLEPELMACGASVLRLHALMSGDPTLWDTAPGVDNRQSGTINCVAVQATWSEIEMADEALASLHRLRAPLGRPRIYKVKARYAMVLGGRATHLGLRGYDVLKTIEAAGADNQKSDAVLRCLYGDRVTGGS